MRQRRATLRSNGRYEPESRRRLVGDVAATYASAPVQDYVVVLVAKEATDALRKLDALQERAPSGLRRLLVACRSRDAFEDERVGSPPVRGACRRGGSHRCSAVSAPASAQVQLTAQIGRVDASGLVGHVGIDLDGGSALAYEIVRYWDAAGQIDDFAVPGSPAWARFEFYPDSHAYDPWTLAVGGAHIHREQSMGPNWLTIGDITLPKLGEAFDGAVGFRIDGSIVSSTEVPDGRVEIDAFQLGTIEFDPFIPPLPRNATGDEIGSFATSKNRGNRWTAGVGWPGRYVLFVRDMATGRRIEAIADIAPGSVPTIDLDAVCFGFYTCQYDHGVPGDTAGTFHPLTPTRVLDTRARLGIRNGPVRTGGGWSPSDSQVVRHDAVVNHELKVTGRFGVPATGVSAVLLNVTAVDAPGAGFVAVLRAGRAAATISRSTTTEPRSIQGSRRRPTSTSVRPTPSPTSCWHAPARAARSTCSTPSGRRTSSLTSPAGSTPARPFRWRSATWVPPRHACSTPATARAVRPSASRSVRPARSR